MTRRVNATKERVKTMVLVRVNCGSEKFATGSYLRSYVNLFSAIGKQAQDEGNELPRDDFGNGYTFFRFDLKLDGCDGGCFHLVRKGNLRIEIHFAAAPAQTVNVVVYGAFEAVLEIDKGRNIIYDY